MAVYIFSKVKEGMEGCVGSTPIVGPWQGGDFARSDHRVVDQLEKELLEIEDKINLQFVKSLTENPIDLGWMSEYVKKPGAEGSLLKALSGIGESHDQQNLPIK